MKAIKTQKKKNISQVRWSEYMACSSILILQKTVICIISFFFVQIKEWKPFMNANGFIINFGAENGEKETRYCYSSAPNGKLIAWKATFYIQSMNVCALMKDNFKGFNIFDTNWPICKRIIDRKNQTEPDKSKRFSYVSRKSKRNENDTILKCFVFLICMCEERWSRWASIHIYIIWLYRLTPFNDRARS